MVQDVLRWRRFAHSSVFSEDLLVQFYGFYGYSVSTIGIAIGAFWGSLRICSLRHFRLALQPAFGEMAS
jgi:hypothetical protein